MNLTYTNGTQQQQQWVSDAIQLCSYPLDKLNANVVVDFVPVLPVSSDIGHGHSYMVTASDGSGGFVVSIAEWADDPTNPNNSGLQDPGADIYEFFKESFVHELGHVTHFTLITTDVERSLAAVQFYKNDDTGVPPGLGVGALSDWSATVWADNIMEAIAEVYKCTFYSGVTLFQNRSNWDIDLAGFEVLMQLLAPTATGVEVQTYPMSVGLAPVLGGTPSDVGPYTDGVVDTPAHTSSLTTLSGGFCELAGSTLLDQPRSGDAPDTPIRLYFTADSGDGSWPESTVIFGPGADLVELSTDQIPNLQEIIQDPTCYAVYLLVNYAYHSSFNAATDSVVTPLGGDNLNDAPAPPYLYNASDAYLAVTVAREVGTAFGGGAIQPTTSGALVPLFLNTNTSPSWNPDPGPVVITEGVGTDLASPGTAMQLIASSSLAEAGGPLPVDGIGVVAAYGAAIAQWATDHGFDPALAEPYIGTVFDGSANLVASDLVYSGNTQARFGVALGEMLYFGFDYTGAGLPGQDIAPFSWTRLASISRAASAITASVSVVIQRYGTATLDATYPFGDFSVGAGPPEGGSVRTY